jgi:hypothetical protein
MIVFSETFTVSTWPCGAKINRHTVAGLRIRTLVERTGQVFDIAAVR